MLDIMRKVDFENIDWSKVPPPPNFDEDKYLLDNPDVKLLLDEEKISTGFEHFMRWGKGEGRHRPFKQ
jgi:hypothetical protein